MQLLPRDSGSRDWPGAGVGLMIQGFLKAAGSRFLHVKGSKTTPKI